MMKKEIDGNIVAAILVIALAVVALFGIPGAIILAAIVSALAWWAKKANREDIQQLVIDALTKKRLTNPDDAAIVRQLAQVNPAASELIR
jgi:cellobiose-specific phosphotransferase system component IIC